MRDSAGRKQTRRGRGQPQSGRRSSSPPPAKQMRVLDTQQKPSERRASPEEKRPTEREKATAALNQGTGGHGCKSWVHPARDGDFLEDAVERTKGKKTICGVDLKGLECRLDKEESKGVHASQRKENRSQAEPHREGLLSQGLGVHGTGVETQGEGESPFK